MEAKAYIVATIHTVPTAIAWVILHFVLPNSHDPAQLRIVPAPWEMLYTGLLRGKR